MQLGVDGEEPLQQHHLLKMTPAASHFAVAIYHLLQRRQSPLRLDAHPRVSALLRQGKVVAHESLSGLRQMTGIDGSLSDVLATLTSPETLENVENYFSGVQS